MYQKTFNSNITLYAAFERQCGLSPEAPALYYMGKKKLSYADLKRMTDAFAAALVSFHVKQGEPVTVCLPNIPQAIAAFYAVSKIGAVAHLVHPLLKRTQLVDYMQKTGSKTLIGLNIATENYTDLPSHIRVITANPAAALGFVKKTAFGILNRKAIKNGKVACKNAVSFEKLVKTYKNTTVETVESDCRADAVYLHSGGTGGEPKTIALSAHAVNTLCYEGLSILGVDSVEGLCMLSVLPMFHGFGLAMGVHAMLINGGANTIFPKFHTRDSIEAIKRNRAHYIIGVPAMYEAMLKSPLFDGEHLKRLKQCFVGGDFVSQNLLDRFNKRVAASGGTGHLYEGYGLTETVTVCCVNTDTANRTRSIGLPLKNIEMRIFDGEKPLKPNEEGEICVAGGQLFNGYLNMPEATAATYFEYDGKRFVRSGDIGHMDADGFVYFKSRQKRMVKVNGIPIFPSEIEHLTVRQFLDVRDVCAFDVPDEKAGAKIVLCLTLDAASKNNKAETLAAFKESLKTEIAERLSVYALPKEVYLLTRLPQTQVGKVDSLTLRAMYLDGKLRDETL